MLTYSLLFFSSNKPFQIIVIIWNLLETAKQRSYYIQTHFIDD